MGFTSVAAVIVAFVLGFLFGRGTGRESTLPGQTIAERDEHLEEAREATEARIEKRKDRIVEAARREGRITNDGVEDLFCISDTTARRYLNELEAAGRLVQRGEGGGTYYEPVG